MLFRFVFVHIFDRDKFIGNPIHLVNLLSFDQLIGRICAAITLSGAALENGHIQTFAQIFQGIRGGIHHKRLNLTAGVDNVFDRFYYDHLPYQRDPFRTGVRIPEPGRSLYVNLSIAFE